MIMSVLQVILYSTYYHDIIYQYKKEIIFGNVLNWDLIIQAI